MTEILEYLEIPLIQNMFMATVLACVLCGIIGTYVVVNRMVSITGGIAHTTFGGVGFAYYLMSVYAVSWMTPMLGALIFGIIAAAVMVVCKRFDDLREDSVIGVLWAMGMAAGVIFMCYVGRSVLVPSSYETILFGNMLLIDSGKLRIMAVVTAVVIAVVVLLYRDLRIMTFDRDFAVISGIRVQFLDLVLHVLIAVTCVMVANVVGIVMIIALMTIPAAMGCLSSKGLRETMIRSSIYATSLSVMGLFVSLVTDTPPGATVVLVVGFVFVLVLIGKHVMERRSAV